MERGVACCVVGLLVLFAVAVPSAATAPTGGQGPAQVTAAEATTPEGAIGMPDEFDPDTVTLSAGLQADGDADWQFTYRMRLENDTETAAFEDLQADVRENTSEYVGTFRERISGTVASAENATDRSMGVSNVSISTHVNSLNEDSLGVVTYSFEWQGFAAVDGDSVTAGDALEGFYLDNETSLIVSWPDGYDSVSVDPEGEQPRDNAVQWTGPLEFGTGQPSVVVAPSENGATTEGGPDEGGDGPSNGNDSSSLPLLVGGLAAVLLVAGAGWLYWSRSGDAGDPTGIPTPTGGGTGGSGGAAASGSDSGSADGDDATNEDPPPELLSNEERVEQFLESQGGRAKQQAVVEALDWTEAKTSQVVKEMRENDRVESFRIGRENVLKLPDAEDLDE